MPRILIIEDDTSLRRALRLSLERSGHEIVEAGNGREGIRRLREMGTKVPILATSGGGRNNPRDYLYIARHLGANQVLEKPFEIETLRTAIATLLAIPSEAGPA